MRQQSIMRRQILIFGWIMLISDSSGHLLNHKPFHVYATEQECNDDATALRSETWHTVCTTQRGE